MKRILIIALSIFITQDIMSQVVFEKKLLEKIEDIKTHTYYSESLKDIKIRIDTVPDVKGGILPPTFSIKRLYGDFIAKNQGLPASLIKEIITQETSKEKVSLKGNIFMFKDEYGETYVVFLKYEQVEEVWIAEELEYNTYESQFSPAELKKPALNLNSSDRKFEDPDQLRPEKDMIVFGRI